jgi:hypothetical protein
MKDKLTYTLKILNKRRKEKQLNKKHRLLPNYIKNKKEHCPYLQGWQSTESLVDRRGTKTRILAVKDFKY